MYRQEKVFQPVSPPENSARVEFLRTQFSGLRIQDS